MGKAEYQRIPVDVENATKAAQSAALLQADLGDLLRSENPLVSELALREVDVIVASRVRLERLAALLDELEASRGRAEL
jgi:hypothetical protein